ncbi:MAG TPA: iron uptake system protein EfeO [Conexibacter sp.]|jgi:iron uptake system component EfeO|nr:iron uptake system protein EfeO [Conexibacter sp.]
MNRMIPRGGAATALALAASVLAACGGSDSGDSSTTAAGKGATRLAFELTDTGCTPSKATVPAGAVTIVATNPGTAKTDEFELKNADGIIMGERENLAPGLSSDFTLTLQPGRYILNCSFQNEQRDNGTLVVTGTAVAAKAATPAEVADAVTAYKAYLQRESGELLTHTQAFVAALKGGDTQQAKDLFGPTRSHYEQIEPIAESFGDLDPQIDARVNDVADKAKWTGFHRIEQILWQQSTTQGTGAYADKLLADVKRLDGSIAGLDLQAAQIANGAVALLDEVSNRKITGEEDRYSHTDLADFQGNFDGAREAFETLKPALAASGDQALIDQVHAQIVKVQAGLDRYRRNTPLGFALYSALTPQDRRRFAQQIAALAEPMSLVAGKLLQQR